MRRTLPIGNDYCGVVRACQHAPGLSGRLAECSRQAARRAANTGKQFASSSKRGSPRAALSAALTPASRMLPGASARPARQRSMVKRGRTSAEAIGGGSEASTVTPKRLGGNMRPWASTAE